MRVKLSARAPEKKKALDNLRKERQKLWEELVSDDRLTLPLEQTWEAGEIQGPWRRRGRRLWRVYQWVTW